MSRQNSGTKTLVAILIASFCFVSMSSSAEAGWGHHRHFGTRYSYSYGWPSYRSYGFCGNFGYVGYRAYYPSYYPSYYPTFYRSYVPSYYVSPYVGCGCYGYSYGYGYRPWVGFGGYYSSNSVSVDRLPNGEPTIMARAADPLSQIARREQPAAVGNIELKLNVPEDARVTINNHLTSAVGTERAFVVRGGLNEDQYPFVIRAEIERNGQTITETKQVNLRGGEISLLTFDLDADSAQIASADKPVDTTVRLRVPEEAKVFLAGYEMKQKGAIREFKTNKLRAGEELENYSVRVVMGDGKAESREKQLTLVGGETQEVEFDFASSQRLAAR